VEPHNSPQVLAFEKFIAKAELGDEAAIRTCREIITNSGQAAPLCDLMKMCRCLLEIARTPTPSEGN
jgi:hypothetical protein